MKLSSIEAGVVALQQEQIIAYPTEGVYGLGCSLESEKALNALISLKNRNKDKGLIIIAATVEQILPYIESIPQDIWNRILCSWPGPTTFVLPASSKVHPLIKGKHTTVAIRVSDHQTVKELCLLYGAPIISTSANLEGRPPAKTPGEIYQEFGTKVLIVAGELGGLNKATAIIDPFTAKFLRD